MPNKYHGNVCQKCGGTLRYKRSGECIQCKKKRDKKWNRDNPERAKEHSTGWARRNPAKAKRYYREWRSNNIQRNRDAQQEYSKNNPELRIAIKNKRRTRLAGGGGSYTVDEWRELCSRYDNRCLACGKKTKLTADHIVPVAHGGSSNISNIQPLCMKCNSRKSTKHTDYRKKAIHARWIQKKLF